MSGSFCEYFARLPTEERAEAIRSLSKREQLALLYSWEFWARPEQIAPDGDWRTFLVQAGRGWGKTRVGAEWVRKRAKANPKARIALVGATAADVRDVMIEGESGILACSPPWFRPRYEPSKRRLTWPNGAIAIAYSADKPRQLRGPQHTEGWCDEIAAWRYKDAWDQFQFGLRLGDNPRAIVTTTPRPIPLIKSLLADPNTRRVSGSTSTYANRANLAPAFVEQIVKKYEGTRLGRQELYAELLEDNPSALFHLSNIDRTRVADTEALRRTIRRIVVAVDPAVTSNATSNETGIVVVGVGAPDPKKPKELHGYVLDDVSGVYTPDGWAKRVDKAYRDWKADAVVGEVNNGGDLVEVNVRTANPHVRYIGVRASRGKRVRAEPVAGLYEQGKIHHVGALSKLEDQMTTWDPTVDDGSPDRMDALVWGATYLLLPDEMPPPRGVAKHSFGLGV